MVPLGEADGPVVQHCHLQQHLEYTLINFKAALHAVPWEHKNKCLGSNPIDKMVQIV